MPLTNLKNLYLIYLWVLGMGYVILLWHSLSIPYNYFENYSKYFVDLLSSERSLPFGLLVQDTYKSLIKDKLV